MFFSLDVIIHPFSSSFVDWFIEAAHEKRSTKTP
jgi:hypothetical protein